MSKSLSIASGDLSVTGRHYDTVSGKDKLMQDLRCALIEQVGDDPATPNFGSQFESDTYLGQNYTEMLAEEARVEVMSILQNYQVAQLTKIQTETITYNGKNTLSEGEVIDSIDSVDSVFSGDTLVIRVQLTTIAGDQVKIDVPVDTFSYG
jgi:phage baseplate assembly protein W